MKEAAEETGVAVNAYVFMTNHIHLLLTPQEPMSISRMLHSASRRYSGYFNDRYQRTGTLWEGRFHASLVRTDRYVLACHRYIDMNPVRAGIVSRPDAYGWSSHRFYAMDEWNGLVTPHATVLDLSRDGRTRRLAYQQLFAVPPDPGELYAFRSAALSGRAVGAPPPRRGRLPKKCVPDTDFYFVPDTDF